MSAAIKNDLVDFVRFVFETPLSRFYNFSFLLESAGVNGSLNVFKYLLTEVSPATDYDDLAARIQQEINTHALRPEYIRVPGDHIIPRKEYPHRPEILRLVKNRADYERMKGFLKSNHLIEDIRRNIFQFALDQNQ